MTIRTYTVGYVRSQGLTAKWGRNSAGAPIILAQTIHTDGRGEPIWSPITARVWERAEEVGLKSAFESTTVLIPFFRRPI